MEDLAAFDEPGWLEFGMEFVLESLGGDRTVVTTSTLCAATDEMAHRRFARYWRVIRPFSGLLRLDTLAALGRACVPTGPLPTVEPTSESATA